MNASAAGTRGLVENPDIECTDHTLVFFSFIELMFQVVSDFVYSYGNVYEYM